MWFWARGYPRVACALVREVVPGRRCVRHRTSLSPCPRSPQTPRTGRLLRGLGGGGGGIWPGWKEPRARACRPPPSPPHARIDPCERHSVGAHARARRCLQRPWKESASSSPASQFSVLETLRAKGCGAVPARAQHCAAARAAAGCQVGRRLWPAPPAQPSGSAVGGLSPRLGARTLRVEAAGAACSAAAGGSGG